MRLNRLLPAAMLLAAILPPHLARAAGYSIYEQGAAVLGMAGAGTASVSDASAMFFNPAALTRLEGTQLYVGGSALQPVTSFAGKGANPGYGVTAEMVRQTFYPPTVYATRRLPQGWAVGLGLNAPFGLGTEWNPVSFPGRYLTTRVDLQTLNGSACVAYAPTAKWSLAAGADMLWAKARIQSRKEAIAPGGGGGAVDVAAVSIESKFKSAPGWNAALLITPAPQWKFGAYYRSEIIVHVDDAPVTFTQIPSGNPVFDAGVAAQLPPAQTVSTVLHFPAMWSAGAAWNPRPQWTVAGEFDVHEWRAFKELPIHFNQTTAASVTRIEDYTNAWQIRLGAEHRLSCCTYRFGYYFDKSPAPTHAVTPLLPDADRHGVSVGLGKSLGTDKRWTVDAYELALFAKRRFGTAAASPDEPPAYQFQGDYKTFVNIVGIALSYRW